MSKYIDLERRFRGLTDEELEDTESLVLLEELGSYMTIGWPELLRHSRVILLAEAGSGKTMEMEAQAKRLVGIGQYAFFVALESLNDEPFINLLSSVEAKRFEAWKIDSSQAAWFFLDSVDELKLHSGTLDRALRHLSSALEGYIDRARVIISCRPSDWRPVVDLATVQNRLPTPKSQNLASAKLPDEIFIEALRRDLGVTNTADYGGDEQEDLSGVRKVAMLPMNDTQIALFAEQSGVNNVTAFIEEVDRQNAWAFACRPLDLEELIGTWASLGHLGTRQQQHEAHVRSKLMDKPDRPDSGVLSDIEASVGAERLALALTLTRTQTIRAPEHAPDVHRVDGILEPSTILVSWTGEKRRALLRRALFDPATYGRVRFHHRSIQEYLAARYLRSLRERGMSTRALLRLLFGRNYGVEIVYPSTRAIATWLSLWCDAIRKELIKREPEALLTHGDPESLSPTTRSELLRSFVNTYGQGDRRGLHISTDEIRRFSNPALASVIRECWNNGIQNDEVRKLLLDMVWLGPIQDCADLAEVVALDPKQPSSLRVSAIRALIASNKDETVHEIANSILTEPASWSDKVVYSLVSELFPRFISADDLVMLMGQRYKPQETARNFEWVSRLITKSIEPSQELAITLRNKMTDLIWCGRKQNVEFYETQSKFEHIVPALAILCDRQLSKLSTNPDVDLIRACVIASQFSAGRTAVNEPITKLRTHFEENSTLRSEAFWIELVLMVQIIPAAGDWHRYNFLQQDGLIGYLTQLDRPWLETALADESRTEQRTVALHALISLWYQRGQDVMELDAIRSLIKGDLNLERILEEFTRPQEPDEETIQIELQIQQQQKENDKHEVERLEGWQKWRDGLLSNPPEAFSPDKQKQTISNIFSWLSAFKQTNTRYNIWDKNALIHAFNSDIADFAEIAFRSIWRTKKPKLWSERPADGKNGRHDDWIYGLNGVSSEAQTPDWTASLSPEEARTAIRYACIEMNGFAPFISDLAVSHSKEVEEIVGGEVSAELRMGNEHQSLPTLQNLTHADIKVKRLLVPRLLTELKSWPCESSDQAGSRWVSHLERVLRVLEATINEKEREAVAEECTKCYEANHSDVSAIVWLKALFEFDPLRGTHALLESLADSNDPDTRKRAISTFAAVFGDHDRVIFEVSDRAQQARALERLVRCAYTYIRPEDDQVHEGSYTPDTRDDAESARNFLLSRLLDTPGSEAYCAVMALSDEDDFSRFSDRLKLLAKERSANNAELELSPYSPEDVVALENLYEAPPQDRDSLFDLMMERLEDLTDYYAHGDFSNRRTIQTISEEPEMQRTLAAKLEEKGNGAYRVSREEEVADGKKTDIRLLTIKGNQKAVIEVKIADKRWSLSQLKRALSTQLVEKYLRDSNCKAGCLLLTNHDKNKYWMHPETSRRLYFSELIDYLNIKAKTLEAEKLHSIRIAVFGLDLTEPVD